MEDYIGMSEYDKEKSINKLWDFLDLEDSKCCFCDNNKGALIRLHQGWCCISCFKDLLEGWDGHTDKSMGIHPTTL